MRRPNRLATLLAVLALAAPLALADDKPAAAEKGSKMTKTSSGLQYEDVKEGTGASPKKGQTCVMHYTGWLWENGEVDAERQPRELPPVRLEEERGAVAEAPHERVAALERHRANARVEVLRLLVRDRRRLRERDEDETRAAGEGPRLVRLLVDE